MAEKSNFDEIKKERFSFVLSSNGNIICRRDFRINNFKERSLGSIQLTDAIEDCVRLINNDLVAKSNIFNWYTAPQVFPTKEAMLKWAENPTFVLENPTFVVLDESDETFVWNGSEMLPYDKPFNKSEYAKPVNNDTPCVMKFAFLDNGKEIRSISWDGNIYPKFVRNNIDLSNSKNKFAAEGVFAPMEAFLTDRFVKSQSDLIPELMRIIYTTCSRDDERYESVVDYGGRKYDINIAGQQDAYYKKIEAEHRKKTNAYFSNAL